MQALYVCCYVAWPTGLCQLASKVGVRRLSCALKVPLYSDSKRKHARSPCHLHRYRSSHECLSLCSLNRLTSRSYPFANNHRGRRAGLLMSVLPHHHRTTGGRGGAMTSPPGGRVTYLSPTYIYIYIYIHIYIYIYIHTYIILYIHIYTGHITGRASSLQPPLAQTAAQH